MSQRPTDSPAPWIAAGSAGLVLIALLAVYFFALRPDEGAVAGDLTGRERSAMAAAATETANLSSYRRAHFGADYQRALAGTTGSLHKDVEAERSKVLNTITSGKFDLTGKATNTALVGPSDAGNGYIVLVTVNGYQSTRKDVPIQQDLQVTMLNKGGKWLASDVSNVGVS